MKLQYEWNWRHLGINQQIVFVHLSGHLSVVLAFG
jgi:hypothetical protein